MKLKQILNENTISESEALKITNAKLKELGYRPIKKLGGWGSYSTDKWFSYTVSVPTELKPVYKTMEVLIHGAFSPEAHYRYNPNPGVMLQISVYLDGGTVPKTKFSIWMRYYMETKKWREMLIDKDKK